MNSVDMESPVEEQPGKPKLRVWFDRCMLLLFLATIVWALVATFRFHSPGDGFSILFLALIVGLVCRPTRILAIPVCFLLLMVISLPGREMARAPARSSQCRNRLKLIMSALHNYHDDYGCFPPAYVADENGQPAHSWRVLILPYLEQEDLYQKYRFDEAWNGPSNSQLSYSLQCPVEPNRHSANTSYVLIAGDGTAWADGRAPKLDEFTDGADQTIVLVEVTGPNISWLEPRDLTLEEAMSGINTRAHPWESPRGILQQGERRDRARLTWLSLTAQPSISRTIFPSTISESC